jgi:hypothetical protein
MISHLPSPGLRIQSMHDTAQFAYGLDYTGHMVYPNVA